MRILIVDDEAGIANGIQHMLRQLLPIPCKIETANSAEEALKKSALFHPDLLITDIVMPGMDGLEMVERFGRLEPAPYVIILSGHDQFSYAQTALRYGALDYLLKPVSSEQLVAQCMRVHGLLPKNYTGAQPLRLSSIPFFSRPLHDPSYPNSLKRIIAHMEQNYMKELTLQGIADELMLHANYMSSLINGHFGHSFNYLLDCIRLSKALSLMASEKDMSNAEVSYLVGYNNERRLYHAFQRRLGFTPGWFREHLAEYT